MDQQFLVKKSSGKWWIKMKNITININSFQTKTFDKIVYIEWDEIKKVLGKKRYKEFCKFMNGQTCIKQGAQGQRCLKGMF